ncbi:MAG TPA: hypothetical protein VGO59_04915 [Verrucomicrobiae bacterium]|jgi:hypothetical protein
MKSLLLVGGALGWVLGMGASYSRGNAWPACLWHGCLAAYLSALLMRWWGRSWRQSLAQSLQEREQSESAITPTVTIPKVSRT